MKLLSFIFIPSKDLEESNVPYQLIEELDQKSDDGTTEHIVVMAIGCKKCSEIKFQITNLALEYSTKFNASPSAENKLNTAWAVWCFGLLALNPAGTARNKFFYDQIRNLCQINTPDEDMLCVTSSFDKFLEFKEQDIVKQ